ncbi:MAG: sel1 repeat family protein [Betaproteobacteria bacterium]|nr:sel1 repeat family protein [Betaproteobacteria bacterium]
MDTASRKEPYRTAQELLNQKQFAEAFAAYEVLAKGGDARCQVQVGWMYNEGLGVEKNKEQALIWFQGAANLGSKEGAFYCGKSALACRDYESALRWFHQAGVQEYGPALLWLGLAHVRGWGTNLDLEKGVKYLERASKTGNFPARRELAILMISGKLGIAKILVGLIFFPYAVIAAVIDGLSRGHSDKLIG